MRILFASALTLTSVCCFAQHPTTTGTFADLIKTGDRIAYSRDDETGTYFFGIYDPRVFEIVVASQTMTSEELGKKYPELETAKQNAIENERESWNNRTDQIPTGKSLRFTAHILPSQWKQFATVKHVGDDYVLLASHQDPEEVYAIQLRWVTSITWHSKPPISALTIFDNSDSVDTP